MRDSVMIVRHRWSSRECQFHSFVVLGSMRLDLLPPPRVLGDPDPFLWSGFGDTLDQLGAQNIKGISILVERLYAG